MIDDTNRRRVPHWRSPTILVGALVAGLLLAGIHHAFYRSLNGATVSSELIKVGSYSASQQQINIAAGTALAFLVKAALVLSTSVAYTQLLFRYMSIKSFTLTKLDDWHSALNNVVSLVVIVTDYRYPLIAFVAINTW